MTIKSLLFILFLCLCLVWVGAAYLRPGPDFPRVGLLWTALVLMAALAMVLGARLWGWWRLWRAKAAVRPVAPAKTARIVHEDDAALAALIADANAALAKAPGYAGSRGKSPLSGLPLYLLIGPEGAGKTSTFLNSGVEPQLLAGQASGSAPVSTRLCNLWLAKNAVFAEISGRVFSGEISRWSELLSVLRGKASVPFWRRLWREPDEGLMLRGVIGFCDVRELTGAAADPQRLERGCRDWQERLRAVGEVFGVEFPVYQVFTKCDKIPFFPDFFGRLPESEVNQILGCTLPIRKPDPTPAGEVFAEAEAKRLTGAFRPLYHSLAERRLTHLAHEPNPARKPGIYEFPRELKRIRAPLVQFLTDVFRPHPLRPVPVLRGFYLTAVQEVEVAIAKPAASEADWTSPNLSMETTRLFRGDATQIFNPDEPDRTGPPRGRKGMGTRWIFVSDLFHQIVLADRPPLQRAAPKDARFERYRRGVFAAICAVCVLLCLAFVNSWSKNRGLLHDVEDAGRSADIAKHGDLATVDDLRLLDDLRKQVDGLEHHESWWYHWGLYKGNAILDDARKAYFGRFQRLLLNDLNGVILGQLRNLSATPSPNDPDEPAYSQLKTHLTISSGSCKADPELVSRILKGTGGQLAPDAGPTWHVLANRQIDFYASALSRGNPCQLKEDTTARDHARQYLLGIKGIDRIYRGILEAAEKNVPRPQQLENLAPNYKQVLNGDGAISAAFTQAGWHFVQSASKKAGNTGAPDDSCVIGNSPGLVSALKQDDVEKKIQQRFIQEYIDRWQKYVAGFSVVPYKNAADAAQKLDILAGNKSPLLALLKLTADQTDFPPIATETSVFEKVPVVGGVFKEREKAAHQLAATLTDTSHTLSTVDITRFFQPVHYVVPAASERWINEKNGAYMDALAALRSAVQATTRSLVDTPDPQIAMQSVDKAEDSVRQLEKGFDPGGGGDLDRQVSRLLEEPITNATRFLNPPNPDQKVGTDLQKFCSSLQPLLRKYPFNPSAQEGSPGTEATLNELGDYFAPQGKIWKFQKSALAEFTILDGAVWKQNPASQKVKASQGLLDFLNGAQGITKAFFQDGGTSPHLSYSLRPRLDPNSDQLITLEIDGKSYEFNRNSVLQQQFTWPPAAGATPKVSGRSGTAGYTSAFSLHEGLWSVFRMFGDAAPRSLKEAALEWNRVKGPTGGFGPIEPPVKLEFVGGGFPSGVDIFNPTFYEALKCPKKAVQ